MSLGPYQEVFIASECYSLGRFFNTRTSSSLYTNVLSLNLKSHLLGPFYVPAWVEKKPIWVSNYSKIAFVLIKPPMGKKKFFLLSNHF
jgi:hypothetical protein